MLTEPSWETPSLISLVQSLHETLAGLAEGWLEMGATSFSLWQKDEELLAQWPLACQPICNEPWIVAPVAWGNQSLGELRLTGLTGSSIESRLKAEAALLARIAILEAEMEEVAGELIEKQDTLLALYNLTNSMHSLSLEETLRSLVREASNLTNAQVGMAILSLSGGETLFVQASLEEENLNSGKVFVSQEMALNYFRHFQQDGRERLLNAQNARGRLPEGIENFYFVPISLQNKLVGGLALINRPGGFTSSEAKLVRALSQQGAAQLENVLLYRESLEQARFKT